MLSYFHKLKRETGRLLYVKRISRHYIKMKNLHSQETLDGYIIFKVK